MLANILIWNGIMIFIASFIMLGKWSIEKEEVWDVWDSYKDRIKILNIKIIISAIVFFISLNMIIIGANLK